MIDLGRRMYAAGLVAGSDGNLSVRLDEERLLVTPSGVAKGQLRPADLVLVNLGGAVLGPGRPTSELGLHLAAYASRPDVTAAVHAHPPWTIAASLQSRLHFDFAPESIAALGGVARCAYARPGTPAVAESLQPHLRSCLSFVLERHGSLTLGDSLEAAYLRLEALEHNCKVALLALAGGELPPLPPAEVAALRGGSGETRREVNPVRGGSGVRISDEEALVAGLPSGD
jgi:L-fuculose-phosphate aldolase